MYVEAGHESPNRSTWSNNFRDLVAAVCADALGDDEYQNIAALLMNCNIICIEGLELEFGPNM